MYKYLFCKYLSQILVLLAGISLSSAITNNNNNFGPGNHINNNNNYGYDADYEPYYAYYNPYAYYYARYRHRHRHPQDIVNNNGGSMDGVSNNCPYGSIVNNNGPGNVQVVCLRKQNLKVFNLIESMILKFS